MRHVRTHTRTHTQFSSDGGFFFLSLLRGHTDIFTLSHGGNQTSNHASVTVTLCQRSLNTGTSLLTWDYSKISSSAGPGTNTEFLECLAILRTHTYTDTQKVKHFLLQFLHSLEAALPSLRGSSTQSQSTQRKC